MSIGQLMTTGEAIAIVVVSSLAVFLLLICVLIIIDAATGVIFSRTKDYEEAANKAYSRSNGVDP